MIRAAVPVAPGVVGIVAGKRRGYHVKSRGARCSRVAVVGDLETSDDRRQAVNTNRCRAGRVRVAVETECPARHSDRRCRRVDRQAARHGRAGVRRIGAREGRCHRVGACRRRGCGRTVVGDRKTACHRCDAVNAYRRRTGRMRVAVISNWPAADAHARLEGQHIKHELVSGSASAIACSKGHDLLADVRRAGRVCNQTGRRLNGDAAWSTDHGIRRCRIGGFLDQVNLPGLAYVKRETRDVGAGNCRGRVQDRRRRDRHGNVRGPRD